MHEVQVYWRDKVDHLLQWGGALLIVFAGWAMTNHRDFDLSPGSSPQDVDRFLAACGLLAITIPYGVLHPLAVFTIYRRYLRAGVDRTVLPFPFAMTCSLILSLATLSIAFLMSR